MKRTRMSMTVTGHISIDAELREVGEKKSQVLSFVVIVNEYYKNKAGEAVDLATAVRINRWFPAGKNVSKFAGALKKGALVSCIGKPIWKAYEDKDGVPATFPELRADEIDVLKFPGNAKPDISEEDISNANNYPDTGADDDLPF